MSNFFVRIETQLRVATSNWPVEGKDSRQPSLSVRQGQQVIVFATSSETDPGAFISSVCRMEHESSGSICLPSLFGLSFQLRFAGDGFIEGFSEDDPDRLAWISCDCLG